MSNIQSIELYGTTPNCYLLIQYIDGCTSIEPIADTDNTRKLWGNLIQCDEAGYTDSVDIELNGKSMTLDYYDWTMLNLALLEFFLFTDVNLRQKRVEH